VGRWLVGPLREYAEEMLPCPLLERQPQQHLNWQQRWTLLALSGWARKWRATW
jgi:hypothetical protein